VLRRTDDVESSSALTDLRLWFIMAVDVYGGPIRVVVMRLIVEPALASPLAPRVVCEN